MTRPHHIGLSVGNLERQVTFYRVLLGLCPGPVVTLGTGLRLVALEGGDGLRLELTEQADARPQPVRTPREAAEAQGLFHWAIEVHDLAGTVAAAVRAGGCGVVAPSAGNGGRRFAYLADPENNLIELVQASEEGSTGSLLPGANNRGRPALTPQLRTGQ